MRVLVIDVGGTHVKLMHSGSPEARKFDSGAGFTPQQVVAGVEASTRDWQYDVISIGIPSPVLRGKVMAALRHVVLNLLRHAKVTAIKATIRQLGWARAALHFLGWAPP